MRALVERILECPTDAALWPSVLDELNGVLGVAASAMWAANIDTGGRVHIAWSQFNREALSAADRRAIERGEDDDDREAYAFLLRNQRQVIYDEPTMFGVAGREDLPASRPREMARALGLTHRMACALNHSGPWLDCLLLQSGESGRPLCQPTEDHTDILIPILSRSVALGRTFAALRARFGGALSRLGELGIGVFLVNRQGVVMERNAEADRILSLQDGLRLSVCGELTASDGETTRRLRRRVAAAWDALAGEPRDGASLMAIPCPSGTADLLVSVTPLIDATDEIDPDLHCAFVSVIDPARGEAMSAEGLVALGRLSPAEAEIVRLIVAGVPSSELPERRGVSPNTTKTQLRTILQKLGCRNAAEIIRCAAATRLPLRDRSRSS